jgi:hypothetical protein
MELRDYIRETLTQVRAEVPTLTTTPPDPPRQFAAAGLMRCCALLQGVRVLEDSGLGALAGILERQHWETWLVSMHVVLRGDEALLEIAGDDISYKRLLSDKLDLNITYHPDWDGKLGKLNVFELAKQLGPLLEKAGETGNTSVITGYDVTYRVQSTFAVHANLATIGAYLKYEETSWGVEPNPQAPFGALGMTPALHTLHLARYVFEKFGIPTGQIESLGDRLLAFVKAGQAASPAS